ncbi:MAG: sodium:proton antiporter [Vicinamibacterales bacterium]
MSDTKTAHATSGSHGGPLPYSRLGALLLGAAVALLLVGLVTGTGLFVSREGPAAHAPAAQAPAAGHAEPGIAAAPGKEEASEGFAPSLPWVIPFGAILLVVAVFPLLPGLSTFWESNLNKLIVSAVVGLPVAAYVWQNDPAHVLHTGIEYFQFLSLLAALFIVAGGLHLTGNLQATPGTNVAFLSAGYVLASIVGTTGAAMLLIYPLLRTNSERKHRTHTVIFFIFLVCNIGGLLTPIGDPPLFLGYLRGIDFFWFMKLLPLWIMAGVLLMFVYYSLEVRYFAKESRAALKRDAGNIRDVRVIGSLNLLLIAAVVGSVAASIQTPYREAIMFASAGVSLIYTDRSSRARTARERNHFNFHAILEVAAVFAGVFLTMMPALILLNKRGAALGVDQPIEFFYATGLFSSFLDNAPTFLVFLELALGVTGLKEAGQLQVGHAGAILGAVSAGAVFMGANTYIGNAPNFMVRSIAEQRKVPMPSFFGYMGWAVAILLPVFTLTAFTFFVWARFPLF